MKTAVATSIAIGVFVLVGIEGCDETQQNPVQPPGQRVEAAGQGRSAPLAIADRKKWKPSDFFDSKNELEICDAISRSEIAKLNSLVKSGAKLNAPGKSGITVLSWALFEEDMQVFKFLLEHGADPDYRLNEKFDEARLHKQVFPGDSVLFTSLRYLKPQFCVAALKYSRNVKQLDRDGRNLLHVFFKYGPGTQEHLAALLKADIDFNAKGYGGATPCHQALPHPSLCLQLLKAGADPSIQNDQHRDVADILELMLSNFAAVDKSTKHLDPVIAWLDENYREIRKP